MTVRHWNSILISSPPKHTFFREPAKFRLRMAPLDFLLNFVFNFFKYKVTQVEKKQFFSIII